MPLIWHRRPKNYLSPNGQLFAMIANATIADVAELADALDLGSSTARCEGSSPFVRI